MKTKNKKSIFIYSPDGNFCFSLSMFFQDRYDVVTTTNLSILESSVCECSPDLLILDSTPNEELIVSLEAIKARNYLMPILILYVYSAKAVAMDQAVRRYVEAVFYKPFDISMISHKISELVPS